MAEGNIPPSFVNDVNRELARLLRELYNGKQVVTDAKILKLVGSVLESQVTEGFGKTFANVDWNTPDAEMLTRLTRDTWNFASAKNYQQLRDMTLALRDENGNLRSFSDFKEVASGINSQFNEQWLKTEYNDAIGSATMASKWNTFEKESDIMPYLRYSTVGDERVRTEHEALDGIIRKVSDSFWNTHYPPNGYGCRCDVEQLPGSLAVETETIPEAKIPPMFRTNLAKNGLIYPSGHPYYNGVPRNIIKEALTSLPDNVAYKHVDTWETGKKLRIHLLHGVDESAGNIITAQLVAKHFDYKYSIDLMPEIGGEMNLEDRKALFGDDVFDRKCPDARINGELWDFKTFTNIWSESGTKLPIDEYYAKKISSDLRKKGKQAKNIVLVLKEEINENTITDAVNGFLAASSKERKIIIFNGKKAMVYKTSKR